MDKAKAIIVSFFSLLLGSIQIAGAQKPVKIIEYVSSKERSMLYEAIYTDVAGVNLRSRNSVSKDNGKTWKNQPTNNRNVMPPPSYGRRAPVASILDKRTGRFITFFNALDNPNVAKNTAEPVEALQGYYVRYRVSDDNGGTWLYDEPITGAGRKDFLNPFDGVRIGKNAYYLGDAGCQPIFAKDGGLLLPVQATIMASNRALLNKAGLFNPGKGHTYTDVLILRGTWNGSKLNWELSSRLSGNPKMTTRGLIEPTIIQFDKGKILAVMRGSNGGENDPNYSLPSYKWYSLSSDNGKTWTDVAPWKYDNDTNFYSPSSMSVLFKHSSGRVFWLGNISSDNPKGGNPRYPLVIGEVNQNNFMLIKSSIVVLDTIKAEDKGKGALDLGHVTVREDRTNRQLIVTYPRILSKIKNREWITIKLAL